jgi:hypothetical protein
MPMKVTKRMLADAEKNGAEVSEIRKVQRPPAAKPAPLPAKAAKTVDLQPLRDEIKELRALIKETKLDADRRVQELSAIIKALSTTKPVRVKPVRDLDRASPTYLLVSHYDFIPVSYRKLDS